jgi:hypothetical protein
MLYATSKRIVLLIHLHRTIYRYFASVSYQWYLCWSKWSEGTSTDYDSAKELLRVVEVALQMEPDLVVKELLDSETTRVVKEHMVDMMTTTTTSLAQLLVVELVARQTTKMVKEHVVVQKTKI